MCCVVVGPTGCGSKPTELANKDKVPELIVGTWEVTKAGSYAPEGATLEFRKDGKLRVAFSIDDWKTDADWTYIVDGSKINMVGPEGVKEVLKINKLTDTELVTESESAEVGIVTGFNNTSNIPVKSLMIHKPLRHGQKTFELVFADKTFPLVAGKRFFFTEMVPEGVSTFTIRGIEESEHLVYEPGEIERTRTPRPQMDRPLGFHHRGSFPTGMDFVKRGKAEVKMVPILRQYPTEYKRKESTNKDKVAGT
jgi:uncharacterized protein (TIGR03066 family)